MGIWGSVPDWIGIVGGAAAFWFGYRQYVEAQGWKRAEFLAAEMKDFFGDPDVARALIFIDYSKIKLDEQGRPSATGTIFTDATFIDSLAIHTEFEEGIEKFSQDEMVARVAFDALFTGLERFSHYERSGLISVDDLKPYLDYWIKRIGVVDPAWKPEAFFYAVHKFVNQYGYVGVRSLFGVFGVRDPGRN